jgi:fucose-1-phosphate guanylyltransferase
MAHPAPVSIGLNHGVFVLEEPAAALRNDATIVPHACRRFLHKSSRETMRDAGAFLTPSCSAGGEELVFVDSNFFFDRSIAKLLLEVRNFYTQPDTCGYLPRHRQYYSKVSPLSCEVDAYGDFLQVSHLSSFISVGCIPLSPQV